MEEQTVSHFIFIIVTVFIVINIINFRIKINAMIDMMMMIIILWWWWSSFWRWSEGKVIYLSFWVTQHPYCSSGQGFSLVSQTESWYCHLGIISSHHIILSSSYHHIISYHHHHIINVIMLSSSSSYCQVKVSHLCHKQSRDTNLW